MTNYADGTGEGAALREEEEQERLFDRFFPNPDPETEKRMMAKAAEEAEDSLDGDFWRATLRSYLGKDLFENAEAECIKATCEGQTALAGVLWDEVERRNSPAGEDGVFPPDVDLETERRVMDKAAENVEDDIDDGFWGETLERYRRLEEEPAEDDEPDGIDPNDPDAGVPEMKMYLQVAADADGAEPPDGWRSAMKEMVSGFLTETVLDGSASLEEAELKAVAEGDRRRLDVINYVKSIKD